MSPVIDKAQSEYLVRPDPDDPRLTERVRGIDHSGAPIETAVTVERALTIFLNAQEIVTAMTIGDYPEYLALGYLLNQNMLRADDKIFYTTGRLTSEMVIKTVRMGIPILVSRSGFTAWGVDLARRAGLTLIGRARGQRFIALSGEDRIVFDQDPRTVEAESARHRRKAAAHDE